MKTKIGSIRKSVGPPLARFGLPVLAVILAAVGLPLRIAFNGVLTDLVVCATWALWLALWRVTLKSRRTDQGHGIAEGQASRYWHPALNVAAFFLVAMPGKSLIPTTSILGWGFLVFVPGKGLYPMTSAPGWAILVAGLALTLWARRHLGAQWRWFVEVRPAHTLVTTGPYRTVRHPIYSGFVAAFLGSALISGHWIAFMGAGLATVIYIAKALTEEQLLTQHFGVDYDVYRQRTSMVIPFIL